MEHFLHRFTRLVLSACFCLSLASQSFSAEAGTTMDDPEAETLLSGTEQNAESLDTLDTIIETEVDVRGKMKKLRSRLLMDKTVGAVKLQHYLDNGGIAAELMVQGTDCYVRGRDGGDWRKLPIDAQSKALLESFGVQYGSKNEGGIAGLEKSDGAALAAAEAPEAAEAFSAAAAVSGTSEAELPRLKKRGWKKANLVKAQGRIKKRLQRRKSKARFERWAAMDDKAKGRKAMRVKRKESDANRPWDEELVMVDEATGLEVEHRRFIRHGRFPGGKKMIPKGARRLHQVAKAEAAPASEDDELVEINSSRVLKFRESRGAVIAEESETISGTFDGELKMNVKWKEARVNHRIDPKEFDRKRK